MSPETPCLKFTHSCADKEACSPSCKAQQAFSAAGQRLEIGMDRFGKSTLECRNQIAGEWRPGITDDRGKSRFKLEVEVNIFTHSSGYFTGQTVDISESGLAALLKIEIPMGEIVQLEFTVPFGPVAVQATVRERRAFRYGFQFVESQSKHEAIQKTCRSLAIEQSLE